MEKDHTKIRAAILIVSVALLVLCLERSRRSAPLPEADGPAAVMVEVKGDVSQPGTYILDTTPATVGFAAAMAGSPPGIPADIAHQKLISGQSLEIFRHERGPTVRFGRMPGAALLTFGLKLDLNSATLDELLLIPKMHPKIAAAIIDRRREKEWEQTDDLLEIRGVGPKTAQHLQDYLEITPHDK